MGNAKQVIEFLMHFMNSGRGRQLEDHTDDELCECIIDDVLSVTMFERETTNKILTYDKAEMLRFVHQDNHARIIALLERKDIKFMFKLDEDGNIRIRNEEEILQAAMDYCGCVYNGFKMIKGVEYFSPNKELIEEMGGSIAVVENLSMDIHAEEAAAKSGMTIPKSNTLN